MDPEAQLESFIEEAPPEKRVEMLQRFVACVDEILHDYLTEYQTPFLALQAAVSDQEQYEAEHGATRFTALVDNFVIQELYRKTLN